MLPACEDAPAQVSRHARQRVRERIGTSLDDDGLNEYLKALWMLGRELGKRDLTRFGTVQIDSTYRVCCWRRDYQEIEILMVVKNGAICTIMLQPRRNKQSNQANHYQAR